MVAAGTTLYAAVMPLRHWLAALRLFPILVVSLHAATPATAVTVKLGDGAVALDGPWQFHLGDNPTWASPAFDDSQWERLSANRPWDMQGHWAYDRFAWYRQTIRVSTPDVPAAKVALWIPSVGDAYEVYWNGARIGGSGSLPPRADWLADSSSIIPLPSGPSGVLALRVWRAPFLSIGWNDYGGLRVTPQVGLASEIARRVTAQENAAFRFDFSYLILLPLYTLAALISLLAWLSERRKTAYLCMSVFCISMITMLLASSPLGWRSSVPLLLTINRAGIGIRDIALWFMLLWLLELRESRWLRRVTNISAIAMLIIVLLYTFLLMVLWPSRWGHVAQQIEQVLAAFYAVPGFLSLVIVGLALGWGKRPTSSRWVLAIATVVTQLLVVARNVSIVGLRSTHWHAIDSLLTPLFIFHGMAIHPHTATDSLVLAALVNAFYWDSVEQRRRHAQLELEFRNARELQQMLIPESRTEVPGYSLTSAYEPALEVGGDFFQIIPVDGQSTLVVLGDVSGKGLKAAMAVSLIVGAIRALAEEYPTPAALLEVLNRRLCGRLESGFATCIALRLEPQGACAIASAGHPAPLLNGHELDLPGALPLALIPSSTYAEISLRLASADRLALYTDGLLEARNASGELYGFDRLETLFSNDPTAKMAAKTAAAFGQEDDITVLVLTVESEAPAISPVGQTRRTGQLES